MLFKKLWRTIGLYKSQFISMIIMISLSIGIFIGFNMEWYTIEKNVSDFFDKTGFSNYRIVSETGFTAEQLEKVEKIDGVERAARYISTTVDVKERSGDTLALCVTEKSDVSGMYRISGETYNEKSTDGVWLSSIYAEKNNFKVGDSITLAYKNIEVKGKILGLIKSGENLICVRDSSQLMPDQNTHGYCYISPAAYKKAFGAEYYPQIHVISDLSRKEFVQRADSALGKTSLILTRDEVTASAGSDGEIQEGKTMGSVLPVMFLLIAFLTMITTMHRLAAKEKTQIGTLKALGFKDRRIILHYTSYSLMIGIIGSALGIALGYAVAYYIMNPNGMMGTYMDMPTWHLYIPPFCVAAVILVILLFTFTGYLSVKQMLKGTAADALRPYSPKKVKPLLIERTSLFHKLSFGTRWNMRDIMRHKSRTAMSLLGVIGCTVIIICALGMRNTMDEFLDTYYQDAANYKSRIYISDEADTEKRKALAEEYGGDWSATVSVQIEEKAVSLDIYNTPNGKVKFPKEGEGYFDLADDGAYVCRRISDEYGLKTGDKFTVSPYGSDKKYELKVAGITRSVAENIVITPAYADSLKIPYSIDSIYTDTLKEDVKKDAAVKSIQSKQMIMDSFDSFMSIMNAMIILFIGGAALMGVVVLYNLGVMSYTERYREMATLKVVGFKDAKIGGLLIGQNMWVTLIGIIIGIPCGVYLLDYMIQKLASEYEMNIAIKFSTYAVTVLLTFAVSLAVSLMVARKNKKIDMVEALKGAE